MMALASSPRWQRLSPLLRFQDDLHRVALCWHRALSFAAGNELSHLSVGPGRRGGGGNNVDKYANNPGKYWDKFYHRHDNKFFKDRHYLEKDWGRYFYVGNDRDAFTGLKVDLMTLGIALVRKLFSTIAFRCQVCTSFPWHTGCDVMAVRLTLVVHAEKHV